MTFTKYALIYLSFTAVALFILGFSLLNKSEPDRKQQCLSIKSIYYETEWKEEKCYISMKH